MICVSWNLDIYPHLEDEDKNLALDGGWSDVEPKTTPPDVDFPRRPGIQPNFKLKLNIFILRNEVSLRL